MSTTALIVEVLVIGAIALIWIFLFALRFGGYPGIDVTEISALMPILVLPATGLTYAVGWIINFLAERLFKLFFQRKIRDRVFGSGEQYQRDKIRVVSGASDSANQDMLLDRHIIRLARAGVLNFLLLGVGLLANSHRLGAIAVSLSVAAFALCLISFFQWLTRYSAYYQKVRRLADVQMQSSTDPNNDETPKT